MHELATFGGGCFWCFEAIYQELQGVIKVISGYAGGDTENPTYQSLHYENTGHAEVVQISFDPMVISYRELLEVFYTFHDPTTLNRQGNDAGPEYRSIILYHNQEQQKIANDVTQTFAPSLWDNPVVTEIVPLKKFWPAENNQQDFFLKYPDQAYCQIIINPKLTKFRQKYASKLKSKS